MAAAAEKKNSQSAPRAAHAFPGSFRNLWVSAEVVLAAASDQMFYSRAIRRLLKAICSFLAGGRRKDAKVLRWRLN